MDISKNSNKYIFPRSINSILSPLDLNLCAMRYHLFGASSMISKIFKIFFGHLKISYGFVEAIRVFPRPLLPCVEDF